MNTVQELLQSLVSRREHSQPSELNSEFSWRLCAQGDILLERVDDAPVSGRLIASDATGSVIVAEGEATGHHHRIFGSVTLYRDDALARDIPPALYVGHLHISGPTARLEHEEHAPIALARGTYRVRRQRQLQLTDTDFQDRYGSLED